MNHSFQRFINLKIRNLTTYQLLSTKLIQMLKYCHILLKLLRDVKMVSNFIKKIGEPHQGSPKNITNTPKYNHLLREQIMYFLINKRQNILEVTGILKKITIFYFR